MEGAEAGLVGTVRARQPVKATSFTGGNEAAVRKKRLGDFFPVN
jgi:hypothetical protein